MATKIIIRLLISIYNKILCYRTIVSAYFIIFISLYSNAQQSKKDLQNKKIQLQKELTDVSKELEKNRKEKKSALILLNQIEKKLDIRTSLIRNLTYLSRMYSSQIERAENILVEEKRKLEELKKHYALFIKKSYKNRSSHSKLKMLLSSDNFVQAYRRTQYIKQYISYRKKQAEIINEKKNSLENKIANLNSQKREKESLLREQQEEKKNLNEENKEKQLLTKKIKKRETQLLAKMRTKQYNIKKLDIEIKRIIEREIRLAEERKRRELAKVKDENIHGSADKKNKITSELNLPFTKELAVISSNFLANRKKLPWPVKKGLVVSHFGKQPYPGLPGIYIQNNGVEIQTNNNAIARAVFGGVVSSIYSVPSGNKAVLLKHGDFYTLYNNLQEVFVKKGDKIYIKQELGIIYTMSEKSITILEFQIWKKTQKLNPANWLYKYK